MIQITKSIERAIIEIRDLLGYKSMSYQILSSGHLHCHFSPKDRRRQMPVTIRIEECKLRLKPRCKMTVTASDGANTKEYQVDQPYATADDCLLVAIRLIRNNPSMFNTRTAEEKSHVA